MTVLALTTISNEGNQWDGTPGGDDTDDYIFLLSIAEVVRYFGDSGQLDNRPTHPYTFDGYASFISDDFNEARATRYAEIGWVGWWLRSPSFGTEYTRPANVDDYGQLHLKGELPPYDIGGVRPALWLNLE
jgi:hypothetical protein